MRIAPDVLVQKELVVRIVMLLVMSNANGVMELVD
jgi:hypothetical protein